MVAVELRPVVEVVVAVVDCPRNDGVDVLGVVWHARSLPFPLKSLNGVGEMRGGAGDALVSGVGDTGGTLTGSTDEEADGLGDTGGDSATNGESPRISGTAGEGDTGSGVTRPEDRESVTSAFVITPSSPSVRLDGTFSGTKISTVH